MDPHRTSCVRLSTAATGPCDMSLKRFPLWALHFRFVPKCTGHTCIACVWVCAGGGREGRRRWAEPPGTTGVDTCAVRPRGFGCARGAGGRGAGAGRSPLVRLALTHVPYAPGALGDLTLILGPWVVGTWGRGGRGPWRGIGSGTSKPPPPRTAGRAAPAQTPLPARRPRRGRGGHPAAPPDRGRSNTDTQNAGATPGGTRAGTPVKEEGHSKAGEATRTAGTGNQNGGDGRACAWEAATIKGMAWPASPPASGGGCLPQPRWAVCATGAGAHQGQTNREGEKDIWWTARTARGGTGHLGRTETQRGRRWAACGQRCVDNKNSETTPATTSTSSIRQLLGAADAQTAHPAASSTAPAHQLLGSANAETTPAGAPAAAADRTQRPDATCEGKNG